MLAYIAGALLLLLPFTAVILWASWPSVMNSWSIREGSPDPAGLPRYPIKSVILVAFALLGLQGVSEVLKRVAWLGGVHDALPREEA